MDKTVIMKEHGSFNKRYMEVTTQHFQQGIFFDPRDIVQVKYEMLRSVESGETTVTEAARQFGFSREAFYKNKAAYDKGGIQALAPQKPGPKQAHKLLPEGTVFIDNYIREHPDAHAAEITERLREALGISVHKRTIERYLSKRGLSNRQV